MLVSEYGLQSRRDDSERCTLRSDPRRERTEITHGHAIDRDTPQNVQ